MLKRSRCLATTVVVGGKGGVGKPNFTTMSNKAASEEDRNTWSGKTKGIPRKPRDTMTSVRILHESNRCILAGRNRCNDFNSNQYLLISKSSKEAIMVDAGDDWMDDWTCFMMETQVNLRAVFFTHLHIDNLVGLPELMAACPDVELAWNPSDEEWIDRFPAVAHRYGRPELMRYPLPFQRFRQATHYRDPVVNRQTRDIYLDSVSSRSSSFLQLGNLALFAIATPGHSMGHTCLHVPQERLLFTGDLLFYDDIGRVDLPDGSGELMAQSLRTLEQLPDNTMLLPGHAKLTSLGRERRRNHGFQRVYEQLEAGRRIPNVGGNERTWF